MSNQKLFHQNIVVKLAKNRYKSAQTSIKCWSISLKFGPKITCHLLNLIAQVVGLYLVYQWCHMCNMWSRKAKIQPQMAVSGYADIFSIKVDSRLKTILFPTGVATEMSFSSVFLQNYISSPKCRSGSVVGEVFIKCQISPKHPLSWSIWLKFSQETQFISKNEFVLVWATRGPF